MRFKIFLVFGLLFENYNALKITESERRVTLITIKQNRPLCVPKKNESSWEEGVRQTYTRCAKVLDGFPAPTYNYGVTIITSFKTYTDKLENLTKLNSTFIATRSIAVLEALSLFSKLGLSPNYLLYQYAKAFPKVSSAFKKIVDNLSPTIGECVTNTITELMSDLEDSHMETLKQYQHRFAERRLGRCEKIDFESTMKNLQLLINTIALIAETLLNDCDCVTFANDAYEAIAVLALILEQLLICTQGSHSNIGTVLHSESHRIPDCLHSCLLAVDPFIGGMAHAISLITNDVEKCVREFLTSFVQLTHSFNEALDDLIGPFKGARITVGEIKKNIARAK